MSKHETVRSLQAYFMIVAILSGYIYLSLLLARPSILTVVFAIAGLGMAVAYLYLGIRFGHLVVAAPTRVQQILMASGLLNAVALVINLLHRSTMGVLSNLFGFIFLWYLITNTRRLAAEAAQAATATPTTNSGNGPVV